LPFLWEDVVAESVAEISDDERAALAGMVIAVSDATAAAASRVFMVNILILPFVRYKWFGI
jgi:hypothetical protein